MYYNIPPSTKIAEKLIGMLLYEMEVLRKTPKLDKAKRRHLRDLRECARLMRRGGAK